MSVMHELFDYWMWCMNPSLVCKNVCSV